nr:zinc finger, CCHC-type [Tanacetum cinerariifolium]
MAGTMVKDMTTNFRKLDKCEGHDFRRWQKKMHLLLLTLKVVCVDYTDAGIGGRCYSGSNKNKSKVGER